MNQQAILKAVGARNLTTENIAPQTGMTVRVAQKIKEGEKERLQNFEGLVIAVNAGRGINHTFTVRRVIDGIGVEKVFPVASPLIAKIEIVKKAKICKSKLYYTRTLRGKAARFQEEYMEAPTAKKKPVVVKAEVKEEVAEAKAE